jgi:hypothetical protein
MGYVGILPNNNRLLFSGLRENAKAEAEAEAEAEANTLQTLIHNKTSKQQDPIGRTKLQN